MTKGGEEEGQGEGVGGVRGKGSGGEGGGKRGGERRAIQLAFRRKDGICLNDLVFLEEMLRRYPRKGVPLINVCIHKLEK